MWELSIPHSIYNSNMSSCHPNVFTYLNGNPPSTKPISMPLTLLAETSWFPLGTLFIDVSYVT